MDNFVADAIFIDAPPEEVFRALLNPEDMLVWMDVETASVEEREDGEYLVERADGSCLRGRVAQALAPSQVRITECFREEAGVRRGPMAIGFDLRPHDGGVWLTVRQDGLDSGPEWTAFAERTRKEWVRATVALKRHIEQI